MALRLRLSPLALGLKTPGQVLRQVPAQPAPAPTVVTAADVQALKDALAAQQLQIQRLTEQLERQQAWQLQQSGATAAAKTATTQSAPQQMAAVNTSVAVQPETAAVSQPNPQETKRCQSGVGESRSAALQGHHHYAGWIPGGRNCEAVASAGIRHQHALQRSDHAGRVAKQRVRVLRIGAAVPHHDAGAGAGGELSN